VKSKLLKSGLDRFSAVYVWVVLIIIFSLSLPHLFPTTLTVTNIASSQVVVGMVTIGLLFSLSAGVFDLSIGYNVSVVSIFLAILLEHHYGMAEAILLSLCLAIAIGVCNGFVVVVLGIDSFIGTLATSSILEAMAIWFSNNGTLVGLPTSLTRLAIAQPWGIPIGVFYLFVLSVVAWYVLDHTPFGRRLHAVGRGKEASRLAGIHTSRSIFLALVITAAVAGLAAVVQTGTVGAASSTIGPDLLLPAFAGAFLGATQVHPGRPNVWGAIIATYLLATGTTGLELMGAASWVTYMFNGVALLLAVGLGVLQGKLDVRRTRRQLKATRLAVLSQDQSAL
jgi:ribose transport system permease protein